MTSIPTRMLSLLNEEDENAEVAAIRSKARNPGEFHMLMHQWHDTKHAEHQTTMEKANYSGNHALSKASELAMRNHAAERAEHEKKFLAYTDPKKSRKAFAGRLTLTLKPRAQTERWSGIKKKKVINSNWAGGMGAGVANHFEPDTGDDLQQTVKYDTGDDNWSVDPPSSPKSSSNGGRPNTYQSR